MTPTQKKRFEKLCDEMRGLMEEVRITHTDATLFIEDGSVNIYDWPTDQERRPDTPLCDGGYWFWVSGFYDCFPMFRHGCLVCVTPELVIDFSLSASDNDTGMYD